MVCFDTFTTQTSGLSRKEILYLLVEIVSRDGGLGSIKRSLYEFVIGNIYFFCSKLIQEDFESIYILNRELHVCSIRLH